MEPFVEQLKRLCAAHPTRAKWVFVPTHAIGHTLGDRLVLEGTDWANVRFVTPFDIALRMGAPFLVERGIDPSEEGLGPALIMRLLLGLPDKHNPDHRSLGEGGYFRPLAHQPEMARALWSTIRELRMAGLSAAQIKEDAFESSIKYAELKSLVAAYEAFLIDNKCGDRATVFVEAVQHGASLQATKMFVSKASGGNFETLCKEMGIVLVLLAWEDLITDLDDGNALQRELRLYVQDYLEQELTMHERDLLADSSVPTAIEKLFKKVTTIRDSLAVDGFTPGRMGQSYNYFGFSAEHRNISLWFGYSLPEWSKHGAPAVLQLRKQWIKGAEEPVMILVKEYGFIRDEKAEWILPFQVSNIEKWDVLLREILQRLSVAAQDVKVQIE